jgi:hypothetical protein
LSAGPVCAAAGIAMAQARSNVRRSAFMIILIFFLKRHAPFGSSTPSPPDCSVDAVSIEERLGRLG